MILLTGCAGFIGFHLSLALLNAGHEVLGIDNMNAYYDPALKRARLALLQQHKGFSFEERDIGASDFLPAMEKHTGRIGHIVHLAAQAGVRHSVLQPMDYAHSNLTGHLHMLELARHTPGLVHFLYASTSSVYGNSAKKEQSEDDRTDEPLSLYAATKKSGELMSQAYSHLYGIPATGLRFFTVYGPWGRPDMAYYNFALAMKEGRPITVFGEGKLQRDFTYIDDIVDGMVALLDKPPQGEEKRHRILNLGHHKPENVNTLIRLLEENLGLKAAVVSKPREISDMERSFADIAEMKKLSGYDPKIDLKEGIARFAAWFKDHHS